MCLPQRQHIRAFQWTPDRRSRVTPLQKHPPQDSFLHLTSHKPLPTLDLTSETPPGSPQAQAPYPAESLLLELLDDEVTGSRAAVTAFGAHKAEKGFPSHLLCHHRDSAGDRAQKQGLWKGPPAPPGRPAPPHTRCRWKLKPGEREGPGCGPPERSRTRGSIWGGSLWHRLLCEQTSPAGTQFFLEDSKTALAEAQGSRKG